MGLLVVMEELDHLGRSAHQVYQENEAHLVPLGQQELQEPEASRVAEVPMDQQGRQVFRVL